MGKVGKIVFGNALKGAAAPLSGVFVAVFLGAAAFRSGLYFDREMYVFEKTLFIGGGMIALCGLVARRRFAMPGWAAYPLAMAGLYGTSLWFEPASRQGSADEALRWLALACWAILLNAVWRSERARSWGKAAVQSTGLLLLSSGWLGWMGWDSHPNLVLVLDDPELSATGWRLAGYLQYPNAYGAIIAAFLLMQWQAWSSDRAPRWQARLAGVTAIPYGAALLLTESRGACLALLLGAGVALFVAPAGSRNRWLAAIGTTVAGSAALALVAWHAMPAPTAEGGRAIAYAGSLEALLGVALGGTAMILLRRVLLRERGRGVGVGRRNALTMAAVILGTVGAVWLWHSEDVSRLGGHYETAASRWLFYEDAWRMFGDRPWFGFGGDAWRTLMRAYQSEPYVGNEVHSGYLSILLDTGIVGLALLLAMLAVGAARIWKHERSALAPAAVLLAHAAIDFDWSYAFAWLLLVAWVELQASDVGKLGRLRFAASLAARLRVPGAWLRLGRAGLAALMAAGAAAGLWTATRSDAAADIYGAAIVTAAPDAREARLRAVLEANPAYEAAGVRLSLAQLLPLRERASLLAAGLRYEPRSAPLWLQLGIAHAELGNVAQAADGLREALRLDRFSREGQTAALAAAANLAESRREDGDVAGARQAAAAGVEFYERYRGLVRQLSASGRPANDRQFALTVAAQLHAARCLLILDRRDEANALLRAIAGEDDGDWKERALELLDE